MKSLIDWSQLKRCTDVFVDVFVDPQSNELIDPMTNMVVFKNTHGLRIPSKKKTPGSSMRHSCASFAWLYSKQRSAMLVGSLVGNEAAET